MEKSIFDYWDESISKALFCKFEVSEAWGWDQDKKFPVKYSSEGVTSSVENWMVEIKIVFFENLSLNTMINQFCFSQHFSDFSGYQDSNTKSQK